MSSGDCKNNDCTLGWIRLALKMDNAAGQCDIILCTCLDQAPLQNYSLVLQVGIMYEVKEAKRSTEYSVVIQCFRRDLLYEVFSHINQDRCGKIH